MAVKSDAQINKVPLEHKGQLTCYHESSRAVRDEVFRVMFVEPVVFLAPWPHAIGGPVREFGTGPGPAQSGAACFFHDEPR